MQNYVFSMKGMNLHAQFFYERSNLHDMSIIKDIGLSIFVTKNDQFQLQMLKITKLEHSSW
jgi:hypothetical protein